MITMIIALMICIVLLKIKSAQSTQDTFAREIVVEVFRSEKIVLKARLKSM